MKNKYLKVGLITVGLYLLMLLMVFYNQDSVFAKESSDYLNQHTMFIDYLRRNFWASGDFFPQWSMNYGMGQSFVIFFYYGLYNPFVMLSYILPPINPVYVFEFIFLLLVTINSLAMAKLLEFNKVPDRTSVAISVLSSFSGVFIFHLSTHPMFVYYLPIMTCSLVALHYFVDRGVKSFYMLSVGLIFFTNFTFAPMISVLQFSYFIGLLVDQKKLEIKYIVRFFKAYLIGVLMGMMILIPTAVFMLEASSRTETLTNELSLFNSFDFAINSISSNAYVSGIYIIGIVALLAALIGLRKTKYYIVALPMLLVLIFEPLNFAFNLFEYTHFKVYLMYLPLYWVMFGELAKRGNKLLGAVIVGLATIIYLLANDPLPETVSVYLLLLISVLIYLVLYNRNKVVLSLVVVFLVYQSVTAHMIITPVTEIENFTNASGEIPEAITEYRELDSKNNHLANIYSQVPNVYTSLENSYYIQAGRLEYESAISYFVRQTKAYTFDNIYYHNLFAIKNEQFEPNPIVYGVRDQDAYNMSDYRELDKNEKLYAVNQGLFIDSAEQTGYQDQFEFETLYESDEPVTISEETKVKLKVPEAYQDGVLNISFDADLTADDSQLHYIHANHQVNHVMYQDRYGVNENSQVTFRINTNDLDHFTIKVVPQTDVPITYSNFKITYQSLADFEQSKLDVIKPDNFVADMNNSYQFDLKMDTDGYLATTIPYDIGFKIYVDGKKVDVEKIEDLYIGAKLTAGEHQIKIKYNIPGFRIGLIMTVIAIAMIIITFIFDLKKLTRNKNE